MEQKDDSGRWASVLAKFVFLWWELCGATDKNTDLSGCGDRGEFLEDGKGAVCAGAEVVLWSKRRGICWGATIYEKRAATGTVYTIVAKILAAAGRACDACDTGADCGVWRVGTGADEYVGTHDGGV